ncbi:MAG: class I SAM-dependent DNA methyltransferase [Thermodesulfobacteriota bacterium]
MKKVTNTENKFDKAAGQWDSKPKRVQLAQAVAEAIIKQLPLNPEIKALDFGCGTGLVGLELVSYLKSLTAVDTSRGMLAELDSKVREKELKTVSIREVDLLVKNLGEKFNLIFSSMTLHHIDNIEEILKQFYDHLYPGGYLAIADLEKEDGNFHSPDAVGVKHHGFDRNHFSDLLLTTGFSEINFRTVFEFDKEKEGRPVSYPVFLMTARKK